MFEFILLIFIGLAIASLWLRGLMQDKRKNDSAETYGQFRRESHSQEPTSVEADVSHALDGASFRADPTPVHFSEPSRLAIPDEKADAVPLSDLLPDEKSKKRLNG